MKRIIFILLAIWVTGSILNAQENTGSKLKKLSNDVDSLKEISKSGKSKFLLRGYGHAGFEFVDDNSTFVGGSFAPIFVYKQSDRLLFESELEFEFEDGEIVTGFEYANISYLLTKSITLRVGKILLPFGIWGDRLHPAWINKFSSTPLGVGHGGLLPTSDIGVALSGGAYLGNSKINYAFYVINGPRLNEGDDEPEEAGLLHYDNLPDINNDKTFGGRIGFLPFSNSSLEIGFSGMYGKVGTRGSEYSGISSLLYAFDVTYVKNLPFMSSVLDFKAQYSGLNTDEAEFFDTEDPDNIVPYTFENKSSTYFAQLSLRPAMIENKFFRNLEFSARYSDISAPEDAFWETNLNQWELGLNYWLDWRTVFKFTYRKIQGEAGHEDEGGGSIGEAFLIHWAIGF